MARKSQSAINVHAIPLSEVGATNKETLRVNKRSRTDIEMDNMATPVITITNNSEDNIHATTSTMAHSTLVKTAMTSLTNEELPSTRGVNDYDVIKLDRLIDKADRFESHKSFLENCVHNKVIPVGLQIDLTPTIGNNNDEFVEKWHKRLEEFSLTIMQDIVEFCGKTIEETKEAVEIAKAKVKATATESEKKEIMESIIENQRTRKQNLQRGKQKKLHFLKYNRNNRQNKFLSGCRQQNQHQNYGNTNSRNEFQNERKMTEQPQVLKDQPQTSIGLVRRRSNTQLGRKRSSNKLLRQLPNSHEPNDNARTWSSLLKPP